MGAKDEIQMSFRLPNELHLPCKESAENQGQTLAEWIRRAMQEKLEREREAAEEKENRQLNEEQLRNLMRGILTEELEARGIYTGAVRGSVVASPAPKFEKVIPQQRSY